MTTAQNTGPIIRRVDHDNDRNVRAQWIECPWCGQEHPTEFIQAGNVWLGFCQASGRPLEATFDGATI